MGKIFSGFRRHQAAETFFKKQMASLVAEETVG